jgi:EmrB/QacA subfamily drug resistance transporter
MATLLDDKALSENTILNVFTPQGPPVALTKRRRAAVTAGLMLGMFLAALEATVVSTAMPTVVASLGGLDRYSWVFSAYLLTSTASVPLWGRLSDLYGRRSIYLAAIALFLAGSMLAGLSQSMSQLVFFRLLQGLGAGGLIPLGLTITGEIYTLAERTRMQAVFSSLWGVSSIAGPLIGGIITDAASWRWVFYVNVPIGLIAGVVVHRTLPTDRPAHGTSLNWQGGLLLFVATTFLLVAFSEMSAVWAASALASTAAFSWVDRRSTAPILPLTLLGNRTVAVAVTVGFLAGTALFGTLAFVPLFVQVATGASATSAGQILTPLYLTWVLSSIVAARLLFRVGPRVCTVAGTSAVFVACAALPWTATHASRAWVFADIALMGAGLGFSMLSLLLTVQHSVERGQLGLATSLNMFARSIGGAVGVSLMGAILAAGLGASVHDAPAALESGLATLDPALRQQFIVALQRAFYGSAVAAGLAVIAAFMVPAFDTNVKLGGEPVLGADL